MAKRTNRLFEAFKEEAARVVTEEATSERSTSKGGIYTQRDMEAIQVPKAKQIVKEKYNAYVTAAKKFNEARDEMAAAKYNLQNALDRSFLEEERISQSQFWNILGMDDAENIIYRDSDQSYKAKFDRYVRMRTRRGRPIAAGKQSSWDWIDQDTPEDVKVDDFATLETPQDTPQNTLEGAEKQEAESFSGLGDRSTKVTSQSTPRPTHQKKSAAR